MFDKRIRELRSRLNLSQVQLAQALHVTKQSVSNWENSNIQPSVDMIIKIASFFHVSTDYLLGLDAKWRLDDEGLTEEQLVHVQMIINDIRKNN